MAKPEMMREVLRSVETMDLAQIGQVEAAMAERKRALAATREAELIAELA